MPAYSFNIDEKNQLVTVTYDETVTYDDRLNVLDELVQLLIDRPSLNILIDVRHARPSMTSRQLIDYGRELGKHARFFKNNKTTFLDRKPKKAHPFIVPVSCMQGVYRIVEFSDEFEAMEWLNKPERFSCEAS